jgi:hypothetical protein
MASDVAHTNARGATASDRWRRDRRMTRGRFHPATVWGGAFLVLVDQLA